jgi:hypothetical protein
MLMYWVLFLIPATALLIPSRFSPAMQKGSWWLVGIFFTIIVGWRQQVGGDWFNYDIVFRELARLPFKFALVRRDPAYDGIGWIIAQLGGDMHVQNLFCAIIVMSGLFIYARAQPKPWLALLVAVPYLVIVVAMGYTRQSVALGCAMIGLVDLGRGKVARYVAWVLVGALFHKTAVLLLPIAALAASRRRIWTFTWVAITTITGVILLVSENTDKFWRNYVVYNLQSQGAMIRVAMNAVPSVILLVFRNRLGTTGSERKLYVWIAIFSLAFLPMVQAASTAVDRVALYFIPIQMFVFSRIQRLGETATSRTTLVLGTMAYCATVQYVWLNYATYAMWWIPYGFAPLSL